MDQAVLQSRTSSAASNEANSSGVSWSAVIAGGFATAALALILLALGTGLGLSSISLWSNAEAPAAKVGAAALCWLIFVHFASSSMGGYLAGRLRTKWTSIHSDEVYFRDTAHGFLTWAVALVVTAAFLATAATSLVGSSKSASNQGRAPFPDGVAGPQSDSIAYFIDMLFRSANPNRDANQTSDRNDAAVIFRISLQRGALSSDDKNYLDELVMSRTSLSPSEADTRVSEVFSKAQEDAASNRKILVHSLLWAFVALLIGAFSASFSATLGGRQRDHVVTI
jgi:hypothetical protein